MYGYSLTDSISRQITKDFERRLWGLPGLNIPTDILDLIDDQQGDDFQSKHYLEHFAPYFYTYIVGYAALVDNMVVASELPNHKSVLRYVSGQSELAACRIPPAWKRTFDSKEWDGCTEAQVTKAFEGEALRLDKACLTIKSLELAFAGALPCFLAETEFYRRLCLRPAVYVLRGLEADEIAVLKPKRLKAEGQKLHCDLARRVCGQSHEKPGPGLIKRAKSFLSVTADGYPVTYPNARLIRDFFQEQGCAHISITAIEDRTDDGKLLHKRCNEFEAAFVSRAANVAGSQRTLVPRSG